MNFPVFHLLDPCCCGYMHHFNAGVLVCIWDNEDHEPLGHSVCAWWYTQGTSGLTIPTTQEKIADSYETPWWQTCFFQCEIGNAYPEHCTSYCLTTREMARLTMRLTMGLTMRLATFKIWILGVLMCISGLVWPDTLKNCSHDLPDQEILLNRPWSWNAPPDTAQRVCKTSSHD